MNQVSQASDVPDVPVYHGKLLNYHQERLSLWRSMTPAQKMAEVFKLNERSRKLFRAGLRRRFPDLDEDAFQKKYVEMLLQCHNRNY